MVFLGKLLTNAMGLREQNKRLAERKSGRRDRRYDFPLQPRDPRWFHYGGYGGPRGLQPEMPYMGPSVVYRDDGYSMNYVPFRQLDGLPIDRGPRNRPHYHRHALDRGPLSDLPDCPSCDEYDDNLYGPHWDPFDDESILDSLDDLSLGRRRSYERFRPVGLHDHRHLAPHPYLRQRPIQDHEDHHHHRDRHRYHHDHQHHQHGHSPHRGHHGHHDSFDSDEMDGLPGGNRVSGMWERDPHRVGHGLGHEYSTDDTSDHASASTW